MSLSIVHNWAYLRKLCIGDGSVVNIPTYDVKNRQRTGIRANKKTGIRNKNRAKLKDKSVSARISRKSGKSRARNSTIKTPSCQNCRENVVDTISKSHAQGSKEMANQDSTLEVKSLETFDRTRSYDHFAQSISTLTQPSVTCLSEVSHFENLEGRMRTCSE